MTDEARGYKGLVNMKHLKVNHSAKQYACGEATVNGIESFWSTFKHGIDGSFYKISPKHTERYANEFAGRQSCRGLPTIEMMKLLAKTMWGSLDMKDLIADNESDNFARPLAGSDREKAMLEKRKQKQKDKFDDWMVTPDDMVDDYPGAMEEYKKG